MKAHYSKYKCDIKARLKEFKLVKGDDVFYELCFCLCTPQSKAKSCWEVVKDLKKQNFIRKPKNPVKLLHRRTRFHNNKSLNLLKMQEQWPEIKKHLKTQDTKALREWLVTNVRGLGYKEASHFLRNIGRTNLAILDRHILKNLLKLNVIKELPKTLTKKTYLDIEKKFLTFSRKINIPMDQLDLLFWCMETGEVFK